MTHRSFHTASLALVAASAFLLSSAIPAQMANGSSMSRSGQQGAGQPGNHGRHDNSASPDMSVAETNGPHNWTEQQIVTATVHQAWELAGRNDASFFEIVRELAEISARNRNVQIPEDSAAGRRAGEYIKNQARADHDQLLYAIVDKAVQMSSRRAAQSAANSPAR